MLMWLEEYKRSLKMPEAEEFFDLLFYRPVAFLFVKFIYRFPISPNQVTILSLIAGLAAAWYFSVSTSAALLSAGIWYAVANILDCCDGQLARLQNSGTQLGRIVDGVVDYVSSIAIFVGIGIGSFEAGQYTWSLVVVSGLSSALHAIFFDHYQSEFISTVRAEVNFLEREIEKLTRETQRMQDVRGERVKAIFSRIYLRYLRLQQQMSTKSASRASDPASYRRENLRMVRLWSFLGPTTNRTLLVICAFAGRVDLFLWIVATAGNAWLLGCYLRQKHIHRKLELAQV